MSTHQMHQVEALCNRIVLIDSGRTVLYGEVNKIKRKYAGNAVTIAGDGDFNNISGVVEITRTNGEYHLVLDADTSPQDVFRAIALKDKVRIDRFEIDEPSLDDIFISVVQGDNKLGGENA